MSERRGPLESRPWPTQLEAYAVTPGPSPRLQGYDVEGDLAKAPRFTDLLFLSVTGELPSESASRALEIAIAFLVPLSVAHAPIHATALAKMCGTRPSGLLAIAAATLAEDAARSFTLFRAALEDPAAALPAASLAASEDDRASVGRLAALLDGVIAVPRLAQDPSRSFALFAVLWACGLRTEIALTSVIALARIPSAIAEAAPRSPLSFDRYPINAPPVEYEP